MRINPNEKIEYSPEPNYDRTVLHAVFIFQSSVLMSILQMYNRFIAVQILNGRKYGSLEDFINQLTVRGMCEYNKQLCDIEEEIAETFRAAIENFKKTDLKTKGQGE